VAVVNLVLSPARVRAEVDAEGNIYEGAVREDAGPPVGIVDAATGTVYRRRRGGQLRPVGEVDNEGVVYALERQGFWPWLRRRQPVPVLEVDSAGDIYELTTVNRRPRLGEVEGQTSVLYAGGAALLLWLLHRRERISRDTYFWYEMSAGQRGLK
jgi:hypothetical protein